MPIHPAGPLRNATLVLTAAQLDHLRELAADRHLSVSALVRLALDQYLAQQDYLTRRRAI